VKNCDGLNIKYKTKNINLKTQVFVASTPQNSDLFLQNCVKQYFNDDTLNPVITRENGKPFVENLPVHISLSHSADAIVAAVSKNVVGIDIEKIKPLNYKGIAERFFESVPETLEGFFEMWTAKEAIKKATGKDLINVLKCDNYACVKHMDVLEGYKVAVYEDKR
jgi:phosphopantetheinyl transferase (holo-ACP synthase)